MESCEIPRTLSFDVNFHFSKVNVVPYESRELPTLLFFFLNPGFLWWHLLTVDVIIMRYQIHDITIFIFLRFSAKQSSLSEKTSNTRTTDQFMTDYFNCGLTGVKIVLMTLVINNVQICHDHVPRWLAWLLLRSWEFTSVLVGVCGFWIFSLHC